MLTNAEPMNSKTGDPKGACVAVLNTNQNPQVQMLQFSEVVFDSMDNSFGPPSPPKVLPQIQTKHVPKRG